MAMTPDFWLRNSMADSLAFGPITLKPLHGRVSFLPRASSTSRKSQPSCARRSRLPSAWEAPRGVWGFGIDPEGARSVTDCAHDTGVVSVKNRGGHYEANLLPMLPRNLRHPEIQPREDFLR